MTESHGSIPRPQTPGPDPRPGVAVAPSVRVAAGSTVHVPVRVANRSASPRVLAVAALGVDASWVTPPVRTDVLAPGETADLVLAVSPPTGTLPAGYPLAVAAQAVDPATGRAAPGEQAAGLAETQLVVNPRATVSLELEPGDVTAVTGRRFTVVLRNDGGASTTVRLGVEDPRNGRVRLRRRTVELPGSSEVRVAARARVSRPRMIGYGYRHGFAVTATSRETSKVATGSLTQRTVVGPGGLKAVALIAVVAVWLAAAVVLVPQLSERIRQSAEKESAAEAGAGAPGAEDGAGADGGAGAEGGEGADGGAGGAGAGGPGGEAGIQLAGTVLGDAAQGVTVTLDPRSLVDEEMQGRGIGVDASEFDGDGLRLASAFTSVVPQRARPAQREETGEDGAYAFAGVQAPGYYLMTFSKAGYQTQRFVVDSSSEAAKEPLEIELVPGDGQLTGRVTGPDGRPVGGATVTITDGTTSITTSSTSAGGSGEIGSWRVTGLSTPSTYVVTATSHDMSTEARTVTLAASGSASADLRLVAGVALVRGRVQTIGSNGHPDGLGGVTVSVSDGADVVHTATSLTDGGTGMFYVPGVPAPGTYTATFTATGYQPVSRRITLERGDAELRVGSVMLSTATGQVIGRVGGAPAAGAATRVAATGTARRRAAEDTPLAATGLTLTNNERSYKTTSSTPSGRGAASTFAFRGVEPGVYTLSADLFGFEPWHRTVRVRPGVPSDETVVSMTPSVGGGQPSTSTVTGSAVSADDTPETQLSCTDDCLTATLTTQVTTAAGATETRTYTDTFPSDGAYVLPSPEDEQCRTDADPTATCGLLAGPYTVHVSTPGYVATTVSVEAAEATRTTAPVAELVPVPSLVGTVGLADVDGAPNPSAVPDTCVWVETTSTAAGGHTAATCRTAIERGRLVAGGGSTLDPRDDPTACTAGEHRNRGVEQGRTAWCAALLDGARDYRIEVPAEGTYTVTVVSTDLEYIAPSDPPALDLERGPQTYDVALHRLGRVAVTVTRPAAAPDDAPGGVTDVLVPQRGVTPTVDPMPATARVTASDEDGAALITGLPAGTYTVRGVSGAHSGGTGVITVNNRTVPLALRLTNPITSLVGRVLGTRTGTEVAVPGATVQLQGATEFDAAGNGSSWVTVAPVTAPNGCFGVRISSEPAIAPCTSWPAGSREQASFVTSAMRSITVSAPGWETRTFNRHTLDPAVVNDLEVFPALVPVDLPVTVDPEGSTLDPDDVAVAVSDPTGRQVSAGVADDGAGGLELSWVDAGRYADDSAAAAGGAAVPGTYTVTLRADGYAPLTRTVTCLFGAAACTVSQAIVLPRHGTVRLHVVGGDGTLDVEGAEITPRLVGRPDVAHTTRTTDGSGVVELPDVVAGTNTSYVLEVRAPGHRPGSTSLTPGPADLVTLDCTPPAALPGALRTRISVEPAGVVECTLTLTPIGIVQGTLRAVFDRQGDPVEHVEALVGRRVTATRCTTVSAGWCTAVGSQTFSAVTDEDGRFAVHGTLTTPGLEAGTWLLTAPAATGFRLRTPGPSDPQGALAGTLVTVVDGAVTHADVDQYAIPTDLTIEVTDGFDPLRNATVRLVRDPAATTGGVLATATGTGASLRYRVGDLVPGYWWIKVTGADLEVHPQQSVYVAPGSTGSTARVVVTRVRGAVSGEVTETGGSLLVPNVRITLTCAVTGSELCPASGPALSASRDPLTTTTDAQGQYRMTGVVNGEYVVSVSAQGYQAVADRSLSLSTGGERDEDFELTATTRALVASVAGQVDGDELRGSNVRITPVGPTAGSEQVLPLTGTPGAVTGQLSQLRWGCYRVVLERPARHFGQVDGPTVTVGGGSPPADPALSCPSGSLKVPRSGTAPIELRWTSTATRLDYTFTTDPDDDRWRPDADLHVVRLDTSAPIVVVDDPYGGAVWVTPGTYRVEPVLGAADRDWWSVTTATGGVPGGTFAVSATELTAAVVVSVEDLDAGAFAQVEVSAGPGQLHPVPDDPIRQVAGPDGTVTFDLPRGSWVIRGTWSHGPDVQVVTITDRTDRAVLLRSDPDTLPRGTDGTGGTGGTGEGTGGTGGEAPGSTDAPTGDASLEPDSP
jgi:hypothetical protein